MSTTTVNKYKATFILDTRNYTEPVEKLIERITTAISSVGGNVTKIENLGQKHFTRVTSRKFPIGIYVDVTMEGEPSLPLAVNEKLRLDRNIYRIFIVSI